MSINYAVVTAATTTDTPRYGATVSGYGGRIPTRYMVKLAGTSDRWRRVYAACYGNAASVYVTVAGKDHYLNDIDVELALIAL